MINAIYQYGAISVGVESSNLQYYKSGIFGKNSSDCGTQPNHAVVIIGYGGSDDNKYWIIQNSWSNRWGMNGYYYNYRSGKDEAGACGILKDGVYPVF